MSHTQVRKMSISSIILNGLTKSDSETTVVAQFAFDFILEWTHTDGTDMFFGPELRAFKHLIVENTVLEQNRREILVGIFCRIQKCRHALIRFINICKWKITPTFDCQHCLIGDALSNLPSKQKVWLRHNNAKYEFRLTDLWNMWLATLTARCGLKPEPKALKNPYNGLCFGPSHLYAIYFKSLESGLVPPLAITLFVRGHLSLNRFLAAALPMLTDVCIKNYVKEEDDEDLAHDMVNMLAANAEDIVGRPLRTDFRVVNTSKLVNDLRDTLYAWFMSRKSANKIKRCANREIYKKNLTVYFSKHRQLTRKTVAARRLVSPASALTPPASTLTPPASTLPPPAPRADTLETLDMILAALPPSIYTFTSSGPIAPRVQTMSTMPPSRPAGHPSPTRRESSELLRLATVARARAEADLFEPPPLVRSIMNFPRDVAAVTPPRRRVHRRVIHMVYDVVAQGPVDLERDS